VKDFIVEHARYFVFFHVLSAIIWIGGAIVLKFAITSSLNLIEDSKVRFARVLEIYAKYFALTLIFALILVATGAMVTVGFGLAKATPPINMIVHIKETMWLILGVLLFMGFKKRKNSQMAFLSGDMEKCKKDIDFIEKVVLNGTIALGLIAIYFGTVLRGL